jgi:hypothetical protein
MKKIIFLLIISILTQVNGIAQTKTGIELCIEYQKAFSSFASEKEANDALDKILDVIGASKNFTLIPCDDISNAVAVTVKGDRFILYDGAFMRKIDLATNNWSYLFILAHEVGHHINGHTRDFLLAEVLDDQSLADRRKEELEADEFASFIVSKLGASYSQIEETIALIASDGSDLYSTHPNYDKRIAAVKRGFERAHSDNSEEEKTTSKRPDKKQHIPNELPTYLRQGISVDKTTLRIAIEMYAQGWRYTMPSPKSSQASWGNSDSRTTWWNGYWYNNKTRQYSRTVPKKQADGKYLGDYQNDEGYWRRGGSPSAPTKLEWLLSTSGGIKPY